jgi:16S rRNA processing protein RimM
VIPAAERVALEPDAVYISDLVGCSLVDFRRAGNPAVVGTIRDVVQQEETTDLLMVTGENGSEYAIPFAKAYLVRIDLAGRLVEMNLPAGLLDVNAPLDEEERRTRQNE